MDKCSVMKSSSEPLIVEWPSSSRAKLESNVQDRLVVVRYSGCEIEVLSQCRATGTYRYKAVTPKHDVTTIRDADTLYATVPLGAAKLEADLQRAGELNVRMTVVGRYEAGELNLARDGLDGDCDRATHVVSALTVGAFTFVAGAEAEVGANAVVVGGKSTSTAQVLSRDGDEEACEQAEPDGAKPPRGCGALLRIEVTPLEGASAAAKTAEPVTASSGADVAKPDAPPPPARTTSTSPGMTAGTNARFRWTSDVVIDSKTGLQWFRHPQSASTWQDAYDVACGGVTMGGGNWRLPTIEELKSLIDRSKGLPPYDRDAFPGIDTDNIYLSATAEERYPDLNHYIKFSNGGTDTHNKGYGGSVLCVRTGQGTPRAKPASTDKFFTLTTGTARDSRTGLTWLRRDMGRMKADEADPACRGLVLEGKGWRLPTQTELVSLVEIGHGSPTINATVFPGTDDSSYAVSDHDGDIYGEVSFSNGTVDTSHKGYTRAVRCVR